MHREWPDVVLVNGPSSAGKSTLCRMLRDEIPHPYLLLGFDDFVFMSAPRYYRGTDTAHQGGAADDPATALGVRMVTTSAPGEPPCVVASFGPVFRALIGSIGPVVRTLVDNRNSVIIDHVIHDREMHDDLVRSLAGLDVFSIGVTCPIEILEERERARGDRVLGRARGLATVVHEFVEYDVMVDSGAMDAATCTTVAMTAMQDRPG